VLPCIVQLLPKASPLIHYICAYACFRMLAGLHAVTEEQLDKMAEYLEAYQDQCSVCSVFFSHFHHFQVLDLYSIYFSHIIYRKCRNSMAKTSIFPSNMLHHTLVMTLPKDADMQLLHTCWERGSNKNPGGISTNNFKKAEQQVSLHNFLIILSSGRITYLICYH